MINILYLHAGAEMYGADKVLLELIKGLDKKRFNPIVILPCNGTLVSALKREGIETQVMNYPILRRKYCNLKGILKYVISYRKCLKLILKFVKRRDIKIIHVNTTAVLEGIYLKKKLKIPMVWHIHEIIQNPKIVFQFTSWLIGKYADLIVVVSNAVGNHLLKSQKVSKKKIKTIYNGVDNMVFNPNNKIEYLKQEFDIPQDSMVVGMIGRVNAWKGQNDFLAALDPLLAKYNKLYAVLVGGVFPSEEWRMKALMDRANSSLHRNRIKVIDFRSDIANIHNLFDILVLPSTRPDPLPTVVLEAMASGKPIIGYRHGGICEMVKDKYNGLLVEVKNIRNLTAQIEYLIKNRNIREKMSFHSLERQKKCFSLKSYIEDFSKVYLSLVKDK